VAEHDHHEIRGAALGQALALTVVILAVELVAGVASHSLALLSDAGHILTDVFALGLAWFAVVMSRRAPDARRTFGYHRIGILTAMANGATLIVVVGLVAFEAAQRLIHPEPVHGGIVIAAAVVAIAVNAFIGLRLRGGDDLNTRAALLHVVGDLVASIGVVLSGAVILLTGWLYADPIVSLFITALIAWSAIRVMTEAGSVLLESVPTGIAIHEVAELIAATPEVNDVHDLHVWTIAGHDLALSCHVVVPEELDAAAAEHVVRGIEAGVCERFGIGHTTIQVEACHPCGDGFAHGQGEHNHPHPAVGERTRTGS
jgi:cobalt-zinc-cadmium efflux system protein